MRLKLEVLRYIRTQEWKEERGSAAAAARASTWAEAPVGKEKAGSASSDSESEVGKWTEQDGQDLWRSTKEKCKRNPFEHSSYIRKGESVSLYE